MTDSLKDIKEAANRLIVQRRTRDPLPSPVARPAIGAGVGFAEPQDPKAAAVGGIAWPLTELSYASREKHPEEITTTTDGVFTGSIKRTKTISLRDAAGTKGQIILMAPVPPPEP